MNEKMEEWRMNELLFIHLFTFSFYHYHIFSTSISQPKGTAAVKDFRFIRFLLLLTGFNFNLSRHVASRSLFYRYSHANCSDLPHAFTPHAASPHS